MLVGAETIPVLGVLAGVVFGAVQVALPLAIHRGRARWSRRLQAALDLQAKLPAEETAFRATLGDVARIAATRLDELESAWVRRRVRPRAPTVSGRAAAATSLLSPVFGGVVLAMSLVLLFAFRHELGEGGRGIYEWIRGHLGAVIAIVVGSLIALGLSWFASVYGRVGPWVVALALEVSLWVWFWNSIGIPALKDLVGLADLETISRTAQAASLLIILVFSGTAFWVLELREARNRRRRRESTT